MKKLLIGLAGRARSGKTTAAKHLASAHTLQTYAFADPLREGLTAIFNLSQRDFDDEHKEQPIGWLGRSTRELMQSMGTEWGRNQIHPELWLLLAEQNLGFLEQTNPVATGFVISDLRFENEAAFVRDKGGLVIHLLRESAPGVNPHSSEAGISIHDNDFVVHNDETIEQMTGQLDEILNALRVRAAA